MKTIKHLNTFLLLMLVITPCYQNFIVFENIGQMATAITYINTQISMNVTDVERMINEYSNFLDNHYVQFQKIRKDNNQPQELRELALKGEEILYSYKLDFNTLRDDLGLVKWLLPVEAARSQRAIGLAIGLGLGVLGTFMGVYSTAQMAALKYRTTAIEEENIKIVKALIDLSADQKKVQESVSKINTLIQGWQTLNPALLGVRIGRLEKVLKGVVTKIRNTFQMAQAHRLSIDFYNADELNHLYHKISSTANKNKLILITEKPLDLFQLEVSYLSDGHMLHLMLHVPAVSEGSLLNLLRMHPLPVPIENGKAIVPKTQDNVLGLSPGKERMSVHLSSTDLLDCKTINKVFLCERHAVLHKQINDSCVGALYLQDFDSAAQLCPLEVLPQKEVVTQLADNWFLIFSPRPQTARITCANGTESQFYLPEGLAKNHLSSGCRADFIDHVLLTDSSITLENNIQHFDWAWLTDMGKKVNLSQQLADMHQLGFNNPTLADLSFFSRDGQHGILKGWKYALKVLSLGTGAILIIGFLIFCTNKTMARKVLGVVLRRKNKRPIITDIELHDQALINESLSSRLRPRASCPSPYAPPYAEATAVFS